MKIRTVSAGTAVTILIAFIIIGTIFAAEEAPSQGRYKILVIRNGILIDGKGTPPWGPVDIVIKGNIIESVHGARSGSSAYKEADRIIDASGQYILPGLINLHAHIHDRRGKEPIPFEYIYKLWLSCGITSVRDVGSNYAKTMEERKRSRMGTIEAPRIFLYMRAGGDSPESIRKRIQDIKKAGGDGVKIFGMDRDIMKAAVSEAKTLGLRVAHHVGVEETDAWDDAAFGVTTIEHWYGVPDAALQGSQKFPPSYSYSDENDRFRYAGHLWRETDPVKLEKVLRTLAEKNVGWCPTFVIYEANRDLLRAKNQPWFDDFLHPSLEKYFVPNPANHGSYQWNWTTGDEISWKENYEIWMKAVRDFADMGGVVGCGEDAGYIYMLYGFSLIRELELHQEAGFHPIDVIMHATGNNARLLGMDDRLGRVRRGYLADLIVVEGNPLNNLKCLYPTGVPDMQEGKLTRKGGVRWTIKDGIVYDAPALLQEVKNLVAEARPGR